MLIRKGLQALLYKWLRPQTVQPAVRGHQQEPIPSPPVRNEEVPPDAMSTTLRPEDLLNVSRKGTITADENMAVIKGAQSLGKDPLPQCFVCRPWIFNTRMPLGIWQREPTPAENEKGHTDYLTDAVEVKSGKEVGSVRTKVEEKDSIYYYYYLKYVDPQKGDSLLHVIWSTWNIRKKEETMEGHSVRAEEVKKLSVLRKRVEGEYSAYVVDPSGQGISSPGINPSSGKPFPGVVRFGTRSLRAKALSADEVARFLGEREADQERAAQDKAFEVFK